MIKNPPYSTLFSCLYDEQDPAAYIGRGTHYSVFRSVEWLDVERKPLVKPQFHDFAVIWDEDHDERIIPVIERIYMAGLLSPVLFIGERKAGLFILLDSRNYSCSSDDCFDADYVKPIQEMAEDVNGDVWNVDIGSFNKQDVAPGGCQTDLQHIINCKEEEAFIYLKNIDNLWGLGGKSWSPNVRLADEYRNFARRLGGG